MFKSRALNIGLIIMAVLTLALIGSYYYLTHKPNPSPANPTIDDIVANLSVDTDEITTNLKDNKFIKIKFKIEVSNKEAKKELTARQFQVNNTILYILSNKTEQDLEGQSGLKSLESTLQSKINLLMKTGKVVHVYTTEKLIQ
jgi:flagellar FliL protein